MYINITEVSTINVTSKIRARIIIEDTYKRDLTRNLVHPATLSRTNIA